MTKMVALFVLCSTMAVAKCIPFAQAEGRIGDQTCVSGKVLKVAQSGSGTWFLNFCEDYRNCAFTVVVFPDSVKDVGDVRALEGKTIEVFGRIQRWRGHAEIVLRDSRQLKGEAGKLPAMPKEYDVERKGKFSPRAPKGNKDNVTQQ